MRAVWTQLPWCVQISATGRDGAVSPFVDMTYRNVSEVDKWLLATAYLSPAALRSYYGLPSSSRTTRANSMAVAEFGYQFYSPSDMQAFVRQYDLPVNLSADVSIVGPNDPSQPGDEVRAARRHCAVCVCGGGGAARARACAGHAGR